MLIFVNLSITTFVELGCAKDNMEHGVDKGLRRKYLNTKDAMIHGEWNQRRSRRFQGGGCGSGFGEMCRSLKVGSGALFL